MHITFRASLVKFPVFLNILIFISVYWLLFDHGVIKSSKLINLLIQTYLMKFRQNLNGSLTNSTHAIRDNGDGKLKTPVRYRKVRLVFSVITVLIIGPFRERFDDGEFMTRPFV